MDVLKQQNNEPLFFDQLIELGLKDKEVLTYLGLVTRTKISAVQLALEIGLTKQNLYNYLEMLKDKGLVGELYNGKTRFFFAKDIKNFKNKIISSLKDKIKTADLMSKELMEYQIKNMNNFKYYNGFEKIRTLFISEMRRQKTGSQEFSIETCTKESKFSFSSTFMKEKFKLYENIRLNRKVKVNPLVVISDEWDLEREIGDINNLRHLNETRIIKQPLLMMNFLYIWDDKIWLMLINNNSEFELLEIGNQKVRDNYKFIFSLLWEQSTLVYKSKQ